MKDNIIVITCFEMLAFMGAEYLHILTWWYASLIILTGALWLCRDTTKGQT